MNNEAIPALSPLDERSRIVSIDAVRGVALLGIFAMNIMTFAMPFGAYLNPTVFTEHEGADRWTYYVVHTLFDMKMMALFSMLFGVGVLVYAEKIDRGAELSRVRSLWFKRMFILLGFGMVHAYLAWEGDILVSYAVCGLVFLWWMRRMPAWAMVLVAVPFTVFPQIVWAGQGYFYGVIVNGPLPEWMNISEAQRFAQATEYTKMFDPSAGQIEEMTATFRGSYAGVTAHRARMSLEMQAVMIPLFMLWRGTAMMLIGAALYKWRVVSGERTTRFYALFTLANYAVGFPLVIGGILYNESAGWDPAKLIMIGSQFNGFGSIPMAMGHMGLVILIVRALPRAKIVHAVSSVGRMALTNYFAHTLIGSVIFYGYGFGLYGTMGRLEQEMVVLGVWIAQLIWSPLWLARFRFGPAEWLWRSLTYGEAQPMRRAALPAVG